MNIIYAVLAHKLPTQVKRLINRLNSADVLFYIHIDAKAEIAAYQEGLCSDNVFFIKQRVSCMWGDYSIVQATLNLIQEIVNDKRDGIVALVSGQDYPIKNLNYLHSFLKNNVKCNFIHLAPLKDLLPAYDYNTRANQYRVNLSSERWHFTFYDKAKLGSVIRLAKKYNYSLFDTIRMLKKREIPESIELYGGSQWWALNTDTLKEILLYVEKNKKVVQYFKFTNCVDEVFFHTIIHFLQKNNKVKNIFSSLIYVDFSRPIRPLPVIFNYNDLYVLKKQPLTRLFARKFDIECDETILDMIDSDILF
jgi:hypothetical protein